MEELLKQYPDVKPAIDYAFREVLRERPENPTRFVAEKILEFAGKPIMDPRDREKAQGAEEEEEGRDMERKEEAEDDASSNASSEDSTDEDDDDVMDDAEHERLMAKMRNRRGSGRRHVVFSEPVRLDENWEPTVVPKEPHEKSEIRRIMSRALLFQNMEEEQLNIIVDAMVKKEFKAGDVIIQQGDMGDFYYVLSKGTCDIFKDGKLVLQVEEGMGFGELALMYDAPRAATVQATSDVSAWAIDRVTFKQVTVAFTIRKRDLYKAFLEKVPILETLTEGERLTIADALQPVTFEPGAEVVKEGDPVADRFYIVEEGELKATKAGVNGEVCPRLKQGDYFGELALIKDQPRAATVTAVQKSKCLAMDRAAFLRLLGPVSDILRRNMDVYAKYEADLKADSN